MTSIPPRPRTKAGRILLQEHSSGTPHMARHILAIEAEAAAIPAQDSRPLDVERLLSAFFSVLSPRLIETWPKNTRKADMRADIELVAAEYARLAAEKPHD